MFAEFHLSPKVLFGVHVGRGGEGVIEEDESVSLHVEGQVGTGRQNVILPPLPFRERENVVYLTWKRGGGVLTRQKPDPEPSCSEADVTTA